jgi:hypothetical protein
MLREHCNSLEAKPANGISIQQKSPQQEDPLEPAPAFGWPFMTILLTQTVAIPSPANRPA